MPASVTSLNLDCLELIFTMLEHDAYALGVPGASASDLARCALVCRLFYAAAIPFVYKALYFRLSQAKRINSVETPFAVVLRRPALAKLVRSFEIRRLPIYANRPRSDFIRDAVRALALCTETTTFSYTSQVDILPSFFTPLARLPHLRYLHVWASNLTQAQADVLAQLRGAPLETLILDKPTAAVLDVLPRWVAHIAELRTLSIYMSSDLHESLLKDTLAKAPKLTGLHVINCYKLYHDAVLDIAAGVPALRELSYSTWDPSFPSAILPSQSTPELPLLTHLTLSTSAPIPATPPAWALVTLPAHLPALQSLTLRAGTLRTALPDSFVRGLVQAHSHTLERLALDNCTIPTPALLRALCAACAGLEWLRMGVSGADPSTLVHSLAPAASLRTLVDAGDPATVAHAHAARHTLVSEDARVLLTGVPALRIIESGARRWVAERTGGREFSVRFESVNTDSVRKTHWFLPRVG